MKPYAAIPKSHCGQPNSASAGCSACTSPSRSRYRFHQPVRSETKCRSPAGLHAGWKIDSSPARPATCRTYSSEPSSRELADEDLTSVPGHPGEIPFEPARPSIRRARAAAWSRSRDPSGSTTGSADPSGGIATSSFVTPDGSSGSGWRSRTQMSHRPSGVTRPSAYRSRPPDSGVIATGSAPALLAVEPLVREVREERRASVDQVGPTAVLVNGRPNVEPASGSPRPAPRTAPSASAPIVRPRPACFPASTRIRPRATAPRATTPSTDTISALIGETQAP